MKRCVFQVTLAFAVVIVVVVTRCVIAKGVTALTCDFGVIRVDRIVVIMVWIVVTIAVSVVETVATISWNASITSIIYRENEKK